MKASFILTCVLVLIFPAFGQLALKNQLEFTHWKTDDRNILENWTDVTWQRNFYLVGLRYEINRPPDPFIFPQDSLLAENELTFRFAEFYYKNLTARVGNFYSMFGRGLVFRTYEDRNLRVDNNLDGAKLTLDGSFYKLQTLAGKMRDKYNRRKDLLFGVDLEVNLADNLQVGSNLLRQELPDKISHQIGSFRANYTLDWGEIYGELAKPDWHDQFSYYLALNAAYSKWTVILEYKDYQKISFPNFYGTEYNAAPSLTREHAFALLNRHPHALNLNDEKGYQFELTFNPAERWELLLNHSQTFTHAGNRFFEEYYGELHTRPSEKIDTRAAAAWTFDFATNTENITPLLDTRYHLGDRDELHGSYQHQHTQNKLDLSEFDTELLLLEYSRSPRFSLALVAEYTNKNQLRNVDLNPNYWIYGNVTFSFLNNQQLSILYGSRREGFVCVGGICRYEPEFKGIEIRLVNRF
jgi:hypothetical protein